MQREHGSAFFRTSRPAIGTPWTQATAENFSVDDRRRVVNAGILHGRDANIKDAQATVGVGFAMTIEGVLATRGERLALIRVRVSGRDPAAIQNDALNIVEIDADDRIVAGVVFNLDDFDAALAELDARYLAGGAAGHAGTWSVIAGVLVAHNRREIAALTTDAVSLDHRRGAAFAPGEGFEYIRAGWDLGQNLNIYTERAHRLNDLDAVFTWAGHGTSHEGFVAEWRGVTLMTVDGELVSRMEVFDEADIDAALTRFDQLSPPKPRLENRATRAWGRLFSYIAAGDWHAVTQATAENVSVDDRRRVVNAGILHGRDANIKDAQATVGVGFAMTMVGVLATRGERLALIRVRVSGRDAGAIQNDALTVVEIDADDRIVAGVVFDLDDFDAPFAELDARYITGEGAAHAGTWSLIAGAFVALNRHEFPAATTDVVSLDHRRGPAFAPGEGFEYIRAGWDLDQTLNLYIETAHRVNDRGAVFTWTGYGSSHEGFDAEWRGVEIMTVAGDLLSRAEVFDEADLDAALAKFDQLNRPTPRLENAACQVDARFWSYYAVRDWDAMAELLADGVSTDDRRRIVNAGNLHGRDVHMKSMRVLAEFEANMTSAVIAIRGERLALTHLNRDLRDGEFGSELLYVIDIDANDRIAAGVFFDPADIEAAFGELDARYLAGEAAAHAGTWTVIAGVIVAHNRREIAATTPDVVSIDHRRVAGFAPGEGFEYIRAGWDLGQSLNIYIEIAHRVNDLGAVFTWAGHGTSHEGFEAEWRGVTLMTVDGEMVSRMEVFDEGDLDAALARFDELHPQAPLLENAASQLVQRFLADYVAGEWAAIPEMLADDFAQDDRRRVVGAGVRLGRDAQIVDMQTIANLRITNMTSTVTATRGERLVLVRCRFTFRDQGPEAFVGELFGVAEINAHERAIAAVLFDIDNFEAAIAELDARYIAGEAADHAQTWSAIARECAAFNRHELPAADRVTIDHRLLAAIDASDLPATIRATRDLMPDFNIRIEAVHRLSAFGAVVTDMAYGTSSEGFDAEWRMIQLLIVEGDRIKRSEIFDDSDLATALARFEELQPQARRLENAAGRILARYFACFSARDWAAMAELLADDIIAEDRRRVVNAGGRDLHIADNRAAVEIGAETTSSSVIATRGERLALAHVRTFNRGMSGEVGAEMLGLVEIDADERIVAGVVFDLEAVDAAFEELDARYLAGEAAEHAHAWSVIARTTAAFNRHELPAADWVIIDHWPLAPIDASDLPAAIRAIWDLTPDLSTRIEAVHRLSSFGAVVTNTAYGTSPEGFAAEWRVVDLVTVEGDRISRDEFFDEEDLDAAVARFDELEQPTPTFGNVATRVWARATDAFNRRDVDGLLALANPESRYEDRRKGLRDIVEGPLRRKSLDVMFETVPSSWRMEVEPIAIRGPRLSLTRRCYRDVDDADRPIAVELLHVIELDDADLMLDIVSFDPDDLDDAFAELTARWIASGEVAYPEPIEAVDRINAAINRHDWDALATYFDGAAYVNHRQLGNAVNGTIADWLSSLQTTRSLIPNFWAELAEVLARSAIGIVGRMTLKGTSTDGVAIEIPFVVLILLHGERVTRLEAFEEDQRDVALARLQEFNRPV